MAQQTTDKARDRDHGGDRGSVSAVWKALTDAKGTGAWFRSRRGL